MTDPATPATPAGSIANAITSNVDILKQDATNSVQALKSTVQTLDQHAQGLKAHLQSLVGTAEAKVVEEARFVKVHWPWLVAAALAGVLAAHFVFGF